MSTTLHNIVRQVRFYPHEVGGAIGWALVDLSDWLHRIAYRVSGGETPELADVVLAYAAGYSQREADHESGELPNTQRRVMESAR